MSDTPLNERFLGQALDSRLSWQSAPGRWQTGAEIGGLRVWCDAETDFWQRTHYGMRADNGHLLYLLAGRSFCLETWLRMNPQHQYDQAGLMIWISPSCWLKASIEYEPEGDNNLGAVVTNSGFSDWSTQPCDRSITEFGLRIQVTGAEVLVHASLDGQSWQQLRMATLIERRLGEAIRCGLYACSPKSAGFTVDFDYLRYDPQVEARID
jgi:uncharacterized protein